MYSNLRSLIFKLDPEKAHTLAIQSLKFNLVSNVFDENKNDPIFKTQIFGKDLSNPIGIAAGFDKNAEVYNPLFKLGFGFVEVGTITPLPQSGNPKPRVFRLFEENAVINRLGFNNKGVDHLVNNLKNKKYKGIVGVNIGANKSSDGQQRINDYVSCFVKVAEYCDYITINISSPNTPGLRNLHDDKNIINLISSIEDQAIKLNYLKPIFLKISPDEPLDVIFSIAEHVQNSKLTGLIISNTTINKEALKNSTYQDFDGGLSGSPLMEKSTLLLEAISQEYPELPLIGVGGVMNKADFNKKLDAGASLVQIYTGFIIHGPSIVRNILN